MTTKKYYFLFMALLLLFSACDSYMGSIEDGGFDIDFEYDPELPEEGERVDFWTEPNEEDLREDIGSRDLNVEIDEYYWEIEDEIYEETFRTSHVFEESGSYDVTFYISYTAELEEGPFEFDEDVTRTVEVQEIPRMPEDVEAELSLSDNEIDLGESLQLFWNSENADNCRSIDGNWDAEDSTEGTVDLTPEDDAVYEVECSGAGSVARDEASVTVIDETIEEYVAISASPRQIREREDKDVTLSWESEGFDSCESVAGEWDTDGDVEGSETVNPDEDTVFEVECENQETGDTRSDSVEVDVLRGTIPEDIGREAYADKVEEKVETNIDQEQVSVGDEVTVEITAREDFCTSNGQLFFHFDDESNLKAIDYDYLSTLDREGIVMANYVPSDPSMRIAYANSRSGDSENIIEAGEVIGSTTFEVLEEGTHEIGFPSSDEEESYFYVGFCGYKPYGTGFDNVVIEASN